MGKELRKGYTTGSCAAAAAKAAAAMLREQKKIDKVTISLPDESKVEFSVLGCNFSSREAFCYVIKDAGDDPDITNGVQIWAKAVKKVTPEIIIKAGSGIGTVTKPGLPVEIGKPAINPIPRKMIIDGVAEIIKGLDHGVEIELSIPGGEDLARNTLNQHLGILGGLSILGTTGIVRPMSEEAYKDSLVPQLNITFASGYDLVVLTPGNIGHRSAINYGIPDSQICQTSNFIGFMLEKAINVGFKKIILWGHPGKLLKVAGGGFYTHNRICDGRLETLAAYLAALAAPQHLIKKILNCSTTEEALMLTFNEGFPQVWDIIAQRISMRAEKYIFEQGVVGTVLLKDRQHILTMDDNAKKMGVDFNWLL
ncbi:MAG: hypothetical protein VR72_00890 [Clostridiaceae bacterium BRH_c20a]|nr:MAG: hypothetical protein VR72_00890 [Clostridiaceae bacterium BRH_c20a]